LWVEAAERHAVDGVVPPEEQPADPQHTLTASFLESDPRSRGSADGPSLAVSERDALRGHLEVDHRGRGPGAEGQRALGGLGDGLGARQRLGLQGVQVQHVAS